jgi:hypothetical protein
MSVRSERSVSPISSLQNDDVIVWSGEMSAVWTGLYPVSILSLSVGASSVPRQGPTENPDILGRNIE